MIYFVLLHIYLQGLFQRLQSFAILVVFTTRFVILCNIPSNFDQFRVLFCNHAGILQGLFKCMQIIAILCVLEILIEILYNIPLSIKLLLLYFAIMQTFTALLLLMHVLCKGDFNSLLSITVLSIYRYLLQYFAILQNFAILQKVLNLFMF